METITPLNPVVVEFMSRCEALELNEWLQTSFGPLNTYAIAWNPEGYYSFYERGNYFTSKWRLLGTFTNTPMVLLRSNPEIYAQNVFTREIRHLDNWVALLQSFKLKIY